MKAFPEKIELPHILAAVCLLVIAVLIITGALRFFDGSRESNLFTASGRQHLDFRVFYLENDIFGENPIPSHIDYLMSFTDFIEVDSAFAANFSETAGILYSYTAEKRFVIRSVGGDYTVFEQAVTLSEASGTITAGQIRFNTEADGSPGGTYAIFPKEYIAKFLAFVDEQESQMAAENVVARRHRGFTAELAVDFTYDIQSPGFGLGETVVHGIIIPLTSEEYSISLRGPATFEWAGDVQRNRISIGEAALFVAIFATSVFGLLRSADALRSDGSSREASKILRKYSHDIVICDKPAEADIPVNVPAFTELLKLAVNLNKHIRCFKNEFCTEFAVIVDSEAYLYTIRHEKGEET